MLKTLPVEGAGKTTLLNAMSGLIRPKSGCITLNGQTVTRGIRRRVSYVRQTDVFYPHLTLKETLTVRKINAFFSGNAWNAVPTPFPHRLCLLVYFSWCIDFTWTFNTNVIMRSRTSSAFLNLLS